MTITSSQANIIDELFFRTADENYVLARWCAINGLQTDFAWLAVHALEKYLKAVMLYNGRPAKKHGHNIAELYGEVGMLAEQNLPINLTKPSSLDIGHWFERTPKIFFEHLYKNGNADNRYLIFGYDMRTEDLHMLDAMVFAIRRLICTLDDPILSIRLVPSEQRIPTHREVLSEQPSYRPSHSMPLDALICAQTGSDLRFAALNLNLAFAPANFVHTAMRIGNASRKSALLKRVLEPMKRSDRSQVEDGIETAKWLFNNVKIPGDGQKRSGVAKVIYDSMVDAERRLKLISK